MPEAERNEGDPRLLELFDEFRGQLVSPGGAAALLGVSRKTIYTLGERSVIRVFRSEEEVGGKIVTWGPKWVYVPLIDLKRYADRVGRPFPRRVYDPETGQDVD
jgi:hypothetical protein